MNLDIVINNNEPMSGPLALFHITFNIMMKIIMSYDLIAKKLFLLRQNFTIKY